MKCKYCDKELEIFEIPDDYIFTKCIYCGYEERTQYGKLFFRKILGVEDGIAYLVVSEHYNEVPSTLIHIKHKNCSEFIIVAHLHMWLDVNPENIINKSKLYTMLS